MTWLAERILGALEATEAEVGITLVGDAQVRRLNRRYRGIDRATDVLAFPVGNDRVCHRSKDYPRLLGDVVISADTLRRQAKRQGHSPERELVVLMIHGLLHLLGYDHERSAAAARTMKRQEERFLKMTSDWFE